MKPQFFDIHSHVSFSQFGDDKEEVVARMREKDVWTITVGVDYESSLNAVKMASEREGFFATVGLHPSDNRKEEFVLEKYQKLLTNPKVVAVGECGLEYFHMTKDVEVEKKRQRNLFEKQIQLAIENDKPLMLHTRPSKGSMDAYEDILDILESYSKKYGEKVRGNVHFFVGSKPIAKRFLELGFTCSFTGVVTFTSDYDEVIKYLPLSSIMTETDCPYVAPVPHRGERNEPSYVVEVVKRIAEIRSEEYEKVRAQVVENATRVFNIK